MQYRVRGVLFSKSRLRALGASALDIRFPHGAAKGFKYIYTKPRRTYDTALEATNEQLTSAAQIIGEDQHFDGIEFFQTGVVRNKKSGASTHSCSNL